MKGRDFLSLSLSAHALSGPGEMRAADARKPAPIGCQKSGVLIVARTQQPFS